MVGVFYVVDCVWLYFLYFFCEFWSCCIEEVEIYWGLVEILLNDLMLGLFSNIVISVRSDVGIDCFWYLVGKELLNFIFIWNIFCWIIFVVLVRWIVLLFVLCLYVFFRVVLIFLLKIRMMLCFCVWVFLFGKWVKILFLSLVEWLCFGNVVLNCLSLLLYRFVRLDSLKIGVIRLLMWVFFI